MPGLRRSPRLVAEGRYIGDRIPSRHITEGDQAMDPQPVVWLVLQPHGILGTYADEDEARGIAESTGSLLTHLPLDGDYRK